MEECRARTIQRYSIISLVEKLQRCLEWQEQWQSSSLSPQLLLLPSVVRTRGTGEMEYTKIKN